jgi:hypothetical protein
MTAPYLGGFAITGMSGEEGSQALLVAFETTYDELYHHQLYINRTFAGVTDNTTDRSILAYYVAGDWPQEVQILAVDVEEQYTDYGSYLPPRPYNQIKITTTTTGWTDAEFIEVTAGTEPAGAVDLDNIIGKEFFDNNRDYEFITDPLSGSGVWSFEIAGIDGTVPEGNRGTAATASASIYAYPPDVEPQDDETRFALSIVTGDLVVDFVESI